MTTANDELGEGTWIAVVVGFSVLTIATVVLFTLSVFGALLWGQTLTVAAVLLVVTGGTGVGIRYEWWLLRGLPKWPLVELEEAVSIPAAILAGTLITLAGAVELGLSPIVSAGVVGVAFAIAAPKLAIPAYCGAFVGMTSPTLFTTYWHAVLAGTIASGVFLLAQPVFHGIGGKLGTTAFVGATGTVLLTVGSFESDPLPGGETIALVVAYSIIGAVVTFSIHTRLDTGTVFASGIVGAVFGFFLPILHGVPGELMAAGVFSASFAGMSESSRIPDEWWMALSGLFVGLVVVYTTPYLGGSGGKLGTIAFGSCLAVHGFLRTTHIMRLRRDLTEYPRRDTT